MTGEPEVRPAAASALRTQVAVANRLLAILAVVHALYHLVGFALCWRLTDLHRFSYDDVRPEAGSLAGRIVGLGWLGAALGFLLLAVLLVRGDRRARPLALGAAVLSLAVGLPALGAALAGAVADVVIIGAVLAAGRQARRLPV